MSIRRLAGWLLGWLRPPLFTKFEPAPRVSHRRIEHRLLRRLASHLNKTHR